jgi:ribosome maturation factor RimP
VGDHGANDRRVAPEESSFDPALRAELAGIAESAGCELVHVEWKAGVLRLVIDRPEGVAGGVSHEHCASVSRQASAVLDVYDFGAGRYTLEVSSPGLDRPLYRPEDYGRFVGRLARITYQPPGEGKRTVLARLREYEPAGGGRVHVDDEASGQLLTIPLGQVLRARLEVEV